MCRRLKEDIVRSLTSIAKRGTSKIKSIAKEAADIILGAFDYGSFVYTQLKVSPYGYESYNLYPADFGWNSAMYITMEGLNFIENIDRILPIVAEASADLAKSCKKFDYDKCSCAEKFSLSIYPHRFNLITFMKRNELKMFVCDMLSLEELIQTALDRAKPYINRLDFEHITPIISDLKYSIFGINMLENYKKYVKNKEECWHGI
ncbi:MAG: hypothetical protein DRP62_05955 [Planctomycetota bacterium]|nr:MAG: hypothetical protein DRP62_05955 [Planctomycetota bacterium]